MSIPEESRPPATSEWHRHIFHVPPAADWVPEALEKLKGVPALPALRFPRREHDGGISVEENRPPGLVPLAAYLTVSAAPLWAFVSVVQQCLAGLHGLHESGLMHGAISGDTLLIDHSGNVILAGVGAGAVPEEWQAGGRAIVTAGPLPQRLAARDLKDLGRVFRGALGGDADIKMTVSRPDIAPMAAEWIDWLASPETGREPVSAAQAETVFADIRAGRAGLRPWQNKSELPPEVEFGGSKPARPMTEEERRKLRKAAAQAHGSGVDVKNQILIALLIAALAGGGIFFTNHYFASHPNEASSGQKEIVIPGGGAGINLQLADESGDLFAASGGDVEPLADTGETIANLMKLVAPALKPGDAWEKALRSRKGGDPGGHPPGSPDSFLYDVRIFPALGKLTSGMEPGDYYLAWRTAGLVMTPEESMALQSALLRTARYCGVRVLAWTVLPNQAAVILRVLPRYPLPDEKLEKRIA
ncbi:MAG TPA: hypothetical protein VHM91_25285, partial [Verrucomicrobiales bacterium]|nr:hypothetical protein [Verrucomicrobiales bacterium]